MVHCFFIQSVFPLCVFLLSRKLCENDQFSMRAILRNTLANPNLTGWTLHVKRRANLLARGTVAVE